MATHITSFGFRHGLTVHGAIVHQATDPAARQIPIRVGDALILDVRGWFRKNPYHEKQLRRLRGTDKAVQDHIRKTPGFDRAYAAIRDVVRDHQGPVFVGCTGGHHRSVFVAELLGRELSIPVVHQDYHKP